MSTVETAAVDERNDNEGTISNVACVSTEGDPVKVAAKRNRTKARSKFTRIKNVLIENINGGDVPSDILNELFTKMELAYDDLENTSNEFLTYVDLDDDEFKSTENHLEEAYRECYRIRGEMLKLTSNRNDHMKRTTRTEDVGRDGMTRDFDDKLHKIDRDKGHYEKIQVKKLDAPNFSGDIRKFPTFVKDYSKYMVNIYGADPFALRSCLSGKALEVVSGVDDDYEEMWRRLNAYFRNPEKLVDSILSEIKSLSPLRENDGAGFLTLVNTIERCWLDLRKLCMESEMDTASMVSYIERLLPRLQMREWILYKKKMIDVHDAFPGASESSLRVNSKFEMLLTFLLNEKYAIEYMSENIRHPLQKDKTGNINLAAGKSTENVPDDTTLRSLQHAVEELTKCLSSSNNNNYNFRMQHGLQSELYKCWLHKSSTHEIKDCNVFLNMNEKDRIETVRKNKVCFRCLCFGHLSRFCNSAIKCDVLVENSTCNKNHHPLLHDSILSTVNSHADYRNILSPLLMFCKVNCSGTYLNSILDPGATLSLITHRAARNLNLNGRNVTLEIIKIGNVSEIVNSKEYDLAIRDKNGKIWNVPCFGIDEITSTAPKMNFDNIVDIFPGIKKGDIQRPFGNIDLLIGLDCCFLLPNIVQRVENLQLMDGPLGLCVRGTHPSLQVTEKRKSCINHVQVKAFSTIVDLHADDIYADAKPSNLYDTKVFFGFENMGTELLPENCMNCKDLSKNPCNDVRNISIREEKEYQLIKQGLKYESEKRVWYVSYPWIEDPKKLENNFSAAFGHLKSCEKRLIKKSKESVKLYSEQIEDLLERNFAKKLTTSEMQQYKGPVHYLPHHGVHKATSVSTPLRIVFNSSVMFMGRRINDFWAKGPDILNSLFGVLLRFREDVVAIQGDISKMYNSVRLNSLEQHTHRFLWRNMETYRPPDHYCMLTVTFGDRPGGAIAIIAMRETAIMKKEIYPDACQAILRHAYVDDILKSVPDLETAHKLIREIEEVLLVGGFKIKHWVISGDSIEDSDVKNGIKIVDISEGSVLGMIWKPKSDLLSFYKDPNLKVDLDVPLTKRSAFSNVSKIYDPLGLLAPFTLRAKLLMRELCVVMKNNDTSKSAWDCPLPHAIESKFQNFFRELNVIDLTTFNRSMKPKMAQGKPMMIIFSDGSQHAYGACVYVRWKLSDGSFSSTLVCAKNRLTPMKTVTIPRIELMGAVLASRLRSTIENEVDYEVSEIIHIIDSQIVLEQIHKDSYKFGVFVANRVAEVQNTTKLSEWAWTESKNNAADLVTRPMHIDQLDDRWKNGPQFLQNEISNWPISRELRSGCLPDEITKVSVSTCLGQDSKKDLIDVKRFSVLSKLLRVTSIILKIAKQRSFKINPSSVTSDDVMNSLTWWIKQSQIKLVNWRNQFKRLGPCLSADGLITVGRRISGWLKENWDRNYLVLLPADTDFSNLLVRDVHNRNHDGVDTTVSKVRRDYWIPGLYRLVKNIRKSCYKCRLLDKKLCTQVMGILPDERLKPSPPFYTTGLDLFGPIQIKDTVKKRTTMKSYGVIFTCFATRAIYLDVSCGYDTDNFLMVMRRFFAIHGCPKIIRSDPGTQLIAAGKELKEYLSNIYQSELNNFSTKFGFKWEIIKSADAPWLNGCTERLIRSVKRCIISTIGRNVITFHELQTVLFECANIMNERPIGIKNSDHHPLCPNDLLLGRSTNRAPVGNFDESLCSRKRFRFLETLIQTYWKRWQTLYFPTLIIQQKWHVESRNLQKGDIVLVQDAKSIRGQWKLAEVHETDPGKDGKVRNVILRYKCQDSKKVYKGSKDSFINRSVHRLVLILPVEERDLQYESNPS